MDDRQSNESSSVRLIPQSEYPELDQPRNFAWAGRQDGVDENHLKFGGTNSIPHGGPDQNDSMTSYLQSSIEPQHSLPSSRSTIFSPGPREPQLSHDLGGIKNYYENRDEEGSVDRSESLENAERDEDTLSDSDPDYQNVQSNIAKLKDSLRKVSVSSGGYGTNEEIHGHPGEPHGRGRGRPRGRPRGRGRGRGGLKGPRKAAEPTGDIKFRLGRGSQAFIEERYDEAMEIVADVIRINAETHEAWILLASIFKELGDVEKTLTALMCAAHLRPKDVTGWLSCAQFALEETGNLRPKLLVTAKLCFQSAIRANPKNVIEARCGKAAVLHELGSLPSAVSEYKRVLIQRPHDTTILRLLAEVYIDQDDVEAAKDLYRQSIYFYQSSEGVASQLFGWSDINIYVELYAYLGQYDDAIRELKSLSRWVLGRQQETWWDDVTEDDREWDADESRRISVARFNFNQFPAGLYGEGLPLELRTKFGIYRLRLGNHKEAMAHFQWLDPENNSHENIVDDYPDLFREAAESLQECGLHHHALLFFEALRLSATNIDPSLHLQMGKCYLNEQLNMQAEECFQHVIQLDENNIEARVRLAKMYEDLNEQEQAFIYISEIMRIRRMQHWDQAKNFNSPDPATENGLFLSVGNRRKTYYKRRHLVDPAERQREEDFRAERLQEQYSVMRLEQSGMRAGQDGPTLAWMDAAQDLIEDFRSFKRFYPWDKYVHFLGYTGASREQEQTGATPLDADLAAMADRLSQKLGAGIEDKSRLSIQIPDNYRGISFSSWLDIFLDYALCLVRRGRHRESYEICEAAKDAIVFYHSREDMFLIHLCWCTCAVLANDEQTCVSTCRFFTRDYQFTTDTYRMFAALTRLCQSPISWYCSGPTQKYVLRQIKAMDYALVDEEARGKFFAEKGSYSAQDEAGHLIINNDMDVALLMLYGHILYAGTSYPYALNYFFRAHALDPENAMINLSIGLGYIHYGLKRQSENRQFHIMQGLSFLFRYYDTRKTSPNVEERQEAHYNVARAYHMLGLAHLALPYYFRVLSEVQGCLTPREDLIHDAAYNLQTLYAMSGNFDMAKVVTDSWLVI